jgi:hypothetical protein
VFKKEGTMEGLVGRRGRGGSGCKREGVNVKNLHPYMRAGSRPGLQYKWVRSL